MSGSKGMGSDFSIDKIERELVHGILKGSYRANDQLPSVDRLCEIFGAGYQTVRNAVGRLVSRGLLIMVPGEGHRVVELQTSIDLKLLIDVINEARAEPVRKWTLLAQTCGFLRFMLTEIVDRAARHRDEVQLEWLRHLVRMLADRVDLKVDRNVVGDVELQVVRVLAAASGCVTHTAIMNSMRALFVGDFLVNGSVPLVSVDQYWALMEAVANQDSVRAREVIDAAWWRLEEHCIEELKKLGWSETPAGASPSPA